MRWQVAWGASWRARRQATGRLAHSHTELGGPNCALLKVAIGAAGLPAAAGAHLLTSGVRVSGSDWLCRRCCSMAARSYTCSIQGCA